jgi:uncharacterized protein YbjT (DUF2867 family)
LLERQLRQLQFVFDVCSRRDWLPMGRRLDGLGAVPVAGHVEGHDGQKVTRGTKSSMRSGPPQRGARSRTLTTRLRARCNKPSRPGADGVGECYFYRVAVAARNPALQRRRSAHGSLCGRSFAEGVVLETHVPRFASNRLTSQQATHESEKMNILIVGGSQGTGALAVRTALDKGHQVTAFARSPQKLALERPQLKKLAGDFHQAESIDAAVPGHEAVIVTASATRLSAFKENPRYFSQGTSYVIDAMRKAGAKRLVVLSAMGTGESRRLLNPVVRALMVGWLLKVPFEDHERQEEHVRMSGLEWVIARPGRLTNRPARLRYVKKTSIEKVPSAISRADVANFLVEACEVPTWIGHAVQLGG